MNQNSKIICTIKQLIKHTWISNTNENSLSASIKSLFFLDTSYLDADSSYCFPEPCKNGATCVDGLDSYICECVAGYAGNDCSQGIALVITMKSYYRNRSLY